MRGYPPCPYLEFDRMGEAESQRAKAVFFAEAARQGIFLHPSHHWYVSAAHTKADIDQTVEVCRSALRATAALV